jgi:hypothetical protein
MYLVFALMNFYRISIRRVGAAFMVSLSNHSVTYLLLQDSILGNYNHKCKYRQDCYCQESFTGSRIGLAMSKVELVRNGSLKYFP